LTVTVTVAVTVTVTSTVAVTVAVPVSVNATVTVTVTVTVTATVTATVDITATVTYAVTVFVAAWINVFARTYIWMHRQKWKDMQLKKYMNSNRCISYVICMARVWSNKNASVNVNTLNSLKSMMNS
jgi:lauroyl/myristoyl acyltransferase